VIEVSVTIYTCAGVSHEVRADVEKLGPGRYELEWCDKAALVDICLTPAQTHYLRRRCEEAYDVIEREREALGISGLLDDSEPMMSAARDYRLLSDGPLFERLQQEVARH
jgi:hypothetical protein